MQVTIEGTVKELANHGLRVNGKPVTQQMISVLVRLGACEEIGQEEKAPGHKGPTAKIYRFANKKTFNFALEAKKPEEPKVDMSKAQTAPIVSMPALPPALQNLTPNDLQAMIVALQGLHAMTQANNPQH